MMAVRKSFNLLRAISDLSLVRSSICKSDTIAELQYRGQLLNNITTRSLPVADQTCRTYSTDFKFPHEYRRFRRLGVDEKQIKIKERKELENSYVYPPQASDEPRRPGVVFIDRLLFLPCPSSQEPPGLFQPNLVRSILRGLGFRFVQIKGLGFSGAQKEANSKEICLYKPLLKYSWKKMWYISAMIRGMTIDEALKQLSFSPHKGAYIIKKLLLDLQKEAVEKHVCEYKSNLWIEASEAGSSYFKTNILRLRRKRYELEPNGPSMQFASYFVRLREGKPPKHYYPPPATGYEKMEDYIKEQRRRTITMTL